MNETVLLKPFEAHQIEPLHKAFLKAFANYFTTFQPTLEQFEHRVFNKLNIENDLSEIAWGDNQVVGFILHTSNLYRGKQTVYNGGTGVIPEYQRKHLALKLYENIIQRLPAKNHRSFILEVIDKNQKALKFYESLGFRFNAELKCFAMKNSKIESIVRDSISESVTYKEAEYAPLYCFQPSFMDSWPQLQTSLNQEVILEFIEDDSIKGFVIFNPNLGRISQIGSSSNEVTVSLLSAAQAKSKKNLTIMNVSSNELKFISLIESLGFSNEINQFEMELRI